MGTTIDTKFIKFMKVKNFLPVNEQKSIKKFVIHVSQNVIRKIGDSKLTRTRTTDTKLRIQQQLVLGKNILKS